MQPYPVVRGGAIHAGIVCAGRVNESEVDDRPWSTHTGSIFVGGVEDSRVRV